MLFRSDTRAYDRLDIYIEKIFSKLKKYPDKKTIVKLHPGQVDYDIKPIIKKIDPFAPIFQNEDILKLIGNCDFMISLNFSTILLEAMILHKPTIVILPEEQNFEEEYLIKKQATLCVNKIEDLESAIHKIMHDEGFRQKLIRNGDEFVKEYFSNGGNASEEFARFLKIT